MRTSNQHISHLLSTVFLLMLDILLRQGAMAQYTSDSLFLAGSRPIVFDVGSGELRPSDQRWITDSLMPRLQALGRHGVILGRSAASPEGKRNRNHALAQQRRDAAVNFFQRLGFDASRIHFDVVDEEYALLVEMMRQRHDRDYARVCELVRAGAGDGEAIKSRLKGLDGGEVWERLLLEYFPHLRAVRIMAFDYNFTVPEVSRVRACVPSRPLLQLPPADTLPAIGPYIAPAITIPASIPASSCRRELLSLRTNLLEWAAYVPQYGWCPMPNVALEYYPRHGHWTYGASFDCPWWVGNNTNHKYFELRNYQLEARYYLRSSDKSYDDVDRHIVAEGQPAFQRWYVQAYTHAFLYQIGFTAQKGWIGEGLGGGLGFGYVLPLSHDGRWRLDLGMQAGYFWTQYDPFVYGKPAYHGGEIDGSYYYDTDLYRDNFQKRMHRFSWFGPTRVGITLSYDLLYRRRCSKRPGISHWEKGDDQ